MELQDAQQELEQIRYELSYQPEVISNGDLDWSISNLATRVLMLLSTAAGSGTTGTCASGRGRTRGEDCVSGESGAHCL